VCRIGTYSGWVEASLGLNQRSGATPGSSSVPEDEKQAVTRNRKAAEQGNAKAQFALGQMYHNGNGVPEDDKQAMTWYRKAAEQGYAPAQYSLGGMYANGEGVPRDDSQAVIWIRKAAEQGYAGAQCDA
jgi:TPR repeat protein